MVEIIPFLLFLLEWHNDRPDHIEVTRVEQVFIDEAACIREGAALMASEQLTSGGEEVALDFTCQPLPPREEFDAMLEREFDEGGK